MLYFAERTDYAGNIEKTAYLLPLRSIAWKSPFYPLAQMASVARGTPA